MHRSVLRRCLPAMLPFALMIACGSRTGLVIDDGEILDGEDAGDASFGRDGSLIRDAHDEDRTPPPPCKPGTTVQCGSNVGQCKFGTALCQDDAGPGECMGGVPPTVETCNGLDDDCNGIIDDGFNVGGACDGPDTDLCLDDTMSCAGCSTGPNNVEVCNGIDDNCNGIIDADCDLGDCKPALLVTGSVPSDPNCVDFPVHAGSKGAIEYPCTGGPVSANIDAIVFTGNASNGSVTLTGTQNVVGPDKCLWQDTHVISGVLASGALTYSYSEKVINKNGQAQCWLPCTETGTVKITW